MGLSRLLVANRGEIAIRVMRAAEELGIAPVAVYSEDDAESLHARGAAEAQPLSGVGARAYLEVINRVIRRQQSNAAPRSGPEDASHATI